MNGGLSPTNPTLEAAFRTALLHQGVVALAVFAVLAISWVGCRELLPARARGRLTAREAARVPEPTARQILRIGFGVLWIFDAILQAQPQMPAGLPSQVIAPAAVGSPGWVLHLVNWAGTGWSYHPVQDAAGAVWIQLGIGVWLIASARGRWSRLAGLTSVGWGLVVWVFGEAFGSMLAPGQSVLTGAPGGALIYCVAGALIAMPERWWRDARLGRYLVQAIGGALIALAVFQAWPGRGYWQGSQHGRPGSLTAMIQSMAATQQPHFLASLVTDFATFVAAHGFAVNLVAVLVLAAGGAALLTGRARIAWPAVIILIAFFLADWVLVEDLGFLGGLGTDPNNMLPLSLLLAASLTALIHAQVPATASAPAVITPAVGTQAAGTPDAAREPAGGQRQRRTWRAGRAGAGVTIALGTASASVVVAIWSGAVMALGAAPMVVAEANRTADPIIATALNGSPNILDSPAAAFDLTDQQGRQVSLASLRGRVVLLTFLDPVCTNDCPLLAQEFRAADQVLGSQASKVALVAIVANPLYRSLAYTQAFDQEEQLTGVPNWYYLTGSLQQLSRAWKDYYVTAEVEGPGSMVLHPDVAYVIDARGGLRAELNLDPGPGTASSESSFAAELAQAAEHVMGGA